MPRFDLDQAELAWTRLLPNSSPSARSRSRNGHRVSLQQASAASIPRDESLPIAAILAFVGGYIEAYTWIVHHVFANAPSANLVFLWVNMAKGQWRAASHYVQPLAAFIVGVVLASWLRWAAPRRAVRISVLSEIAFLFVVAILHNQLPEQAGTLGLSFVAAFQTVSFPRVEGWTYNSVMVTSNFRQTIEGLFGAIAGGIAPQPLRRSYVFGTVCIAFGSGAASGALATEASRAYSLIVPVLLLVIVVWLCEQRPRDADSQSITAREGSVRT
jgi:uncharacterized membrane protein YoaK (UPF0700 family)